MTDIKNINVGLLLVQSEVGFNPLILMRELVKYDF